MPTPPPDASPLRDPARDMEATAFSSILGDLLRRVPGAYAAALVDGEGETVDYAGVADPFDLRVVAAHVQLLVQHLGTGPLGSPRWVVIGGQKRGIVARVLPDGYALSLLLRRRAAFSASRRALAACESALASEAGWRVPPGTAWYAIDVESDRRGRPKSIGKRRVAVEVLGAVVGLRGRERGFRVRTDEGTELTLIREPPSWWYADEEPPR